MQALATDDLIQRIIDILGASSTPDLRPASVGGPIAQYIFGAPDEEKLNDQYPAIWVKAGDNGGNFYDDAGFANSTQIGHVFTATIGAISRHNDAETAEKNGLAMHDDIRFALRKDPSLTGSGSALVQTVALAWSSNVAISKPDERTDFTAEIVIVARWLLLEDVN